MFLIELKTELSKIWAENFQINRGSKISALGIPQKKPRPRLIDTIKTGFDEKFKRITS